MNPNLDIKSPLMVCAENLMKHGFEVEILPTLEAADRRLMQEIESCAPRTVSYGDSMTVRATGIVERLKERKDIVFYDGFDRNITRQQRIEQKRQGVIADLFFTGVNAVSATGSLHWLDMIGNRIAAIAFGPKRVVLLVGQNKIVDNALKAHERIREYVAPLNAARHPGFNTPCIKTGKCADCNSPHRICNSFLTMDRCFPGGRILVLLIEQELGF